MAKKTVNYVIEWNEADVVPEYHTDCYVTISFIDRDGIRKTWVQEGCWDDGWGVYDPEYDKIDHDLIEDEDVVAWAYKPDVQPCLDFVKEN